MKISRKLAIEILAYLDKHKDFYFPFQVICKDRVDNDGEPIEIEPREWKIIVENKNLRNFELRESLQDLRIETTELLAKGFLEKITGESLEKHIAELVKKYRGLWKEELWESEDIEELGENEYFGGKAEAYEDCLEYIKKFSTI